MAALEPVLRTGHHAATVVTLCLVLPMWRNTTQWSSVTVPGLLKGRRAMSMVI